ncbi:hypothetical protein [Roseofilum casamattae]|uniref:Uncharacterized protein n=1 Tax=Roseofilum casamattae BLCC-M143 TaxID=3022442 RepID=A0ABT7BVK9_9CYAN|nr:hypothetical protein [Roseofilum casamattae]MDJ1183220.1 hypothetical protein [Roseofilum casamattae BLCC-M143]
MNPFPDLHELIRFFEVEPEPTDDNIPCFYDGLTFQNNFGDDRIRVDIVPSYGEIDFDWTKNNIPIASLQLREIEALILRNEWNPETNERTIETLVATFRDKTRYLDFGLRLQPHIQIRWGNKYSYL